MSIAASLYELHDGEEIEGTDESELGEEMPDDDESALARLKNIFDSTFDVLRELAEERGMGIEDIYSSEKVDRGFWGRITRIWKMRMKRRSGR